MYRVFINIPLLTSAMGHNRESHLFISQEYKKLHDAKWVLNCMKETLGEKITSAGILEDWKILDENS